MYQLANGVCRLGCLLPIGEKTDTSQWFSHRGAGYMPNIVPNQDFVDDILVILTAAPQTSAATTTAKSGRRHQRISGSC
nr:hypothetical protein CFP56_41404 [Quercus suber]